jgi:hypothetical protein
LRARLTIVVGVDVRNPANALGGNNGKVVRPAINKATTTLANRTGHITRIGMSPSHQHDPHVPDTRDRPVPRHEQRASDFTVPNGLSETRPRGFKERVHACVKEGLRFGREPAGTKSTLGACREDRPSFPPSPVLGRPSWAQLLDRTAAP